MLVISREDASLVFPAAATNTGMVEKGWGQASGLFHLTSKHHCTITVMMLIWEGENHPGFDFSNQQQGINSIQIWFQEVSPVPEDAHPCQGG